MVFRGIIFVSSVIPNLSIMKHFFTFLSLIFAGYYSFAQLIPYNKSGKWGVVTQKREVIIPTAYKEIELRGGFIMARIEDSTDVYNNLGQKLTTIPGLYVYTVLVKGKQAAIMPLKEGVEVRYLNGEVAVPVGKYDYIRGVPGGFEIMKNGKYGMVDQNLNEVLPPVYKELQNYEGWIFPFNGNTSQTMISARTLKKVPCKFTVHRLEFWERGFFVTDKMGLKGLTDTLCNKIVPNKYKYIYVGEHIIHAQKLNDHHDLYKKNGKKLLKEEVLEYESTPQYYLISTKDKTIFYNKSLKPLRETSFEHVKPTDLPGLFYAKKGNEWGIIDSTAKLVFPFRKEGYRQVYDGYALTGPKEWFYSNRFMQLDPGAAEPTDTFRLVFRNGQEKEIKVTGRFLGMPVQNRIAVIRSNKIGFVDFKGREVIPFVFDYDQKYELMHYGLVRTYSFDPETKRASMFKEGKNVWIDTLGNIIQNPEPIIRAVRTLNNGLKLVYADEPHNQMGIQNGKGEFVIPLSSEPIQFLSERFLVISKNQKKALFDLNARQLTDFKYDMIHDPRLGNLLYVKRDGITGYINTQGEEFFE